MLQIMAINCLGHSIYSMVVPSLVFIVKEKTSPDHWHNGLKVGAFSTVSMSSRISYVHSTANRHYWSQRFMRAAADSESCFSARTSRWSNYFHSVRQQRWSRAQLKTFGTISSVSEVTASRIYTLFFAQHRENKSLLQPHWGWFFSVNL